MHDIWKLSAREVAAAVAAGDVSSHEAVSASLERIGATGSVNAFEQVFADDALTAAKAADDARVRGDDLGPLHGVPVAVKANHSIAGRATSGGFPAMLEGPPALESSPVVDRLTEAGAIIVGRTRMPPGGLRWSTESEEWGPTRNPWNPSTSATGSSGGAAAAVAVGAVPFAVGNDIGGSIRYPAASNGVMGLRPTVHKIPTWPETQPGSGILPAHREYGVEGPIARSVADLRLAMSVLTRLDVRDPEAVPFDLPYNAGVKPRIGVLRTGGGHAFTTANTPEVDSALTEAAEALRAAGYIVEEVDAPWIGEAAHLWWQLALPELRAIGLGDLIQQFGGASGFQWWENMQEISRAEIPASDLSDVYRLQMRRARIRRELADFMTGYPVLLAAASGEPPFPLGGDVLSVSRTHELMSHQWVNIGIPALSLPSAGLATKTRPGEAPLGVQVIGRAFAENQVLDVVEDLSRVVPVAAPFDFRTS